MAVTEPRLVPTFCDECAHRIADRNGRDLCARHKRLFNPTFVHKRQWDGWQPFLRCADVNGGVCELFQPKPAQAEDEEVKF